MVVKIALGVAAGIGLAWSVYQGGTLTVDYGHFLGAQSECLKRVNRDEKGHFKVLELDRCMGKLGWLSNADEFDRDHKLVYKRVSGSGFGFEAGVSYIPKEN